MPKFRTTRYAIWRACERFNIRVDGMGNSWDECGVETQAALIAYDQIRQLEDTERSNNLLASMYGV